MTETPKAPPVLRWQRVTPVLLALCLACGGGGGSDGDASEGEGSPAGGTADAPAPAPYTGWRPDAATTWQWQLVGTVNTQYDVDVYDIDLFDVPPSMIDALHRDGRRVLCYFSGGSYEDWRDDAGRFPEDVLGASLSGWDGERWLDIRSGAVREIMAARLDTAVAKNCDGVEPDNMDGYVNDSGFRLSAEDQLAFNRWMANAAHDRGLFVALKNDVDQIEALEPYFDLQVNEQCHQYRECGLLTPFILAGKPVFNAEYAREYVTDADALCGQAREEQIRTLVLPLDLDDSFRVSCD